ncbi:Ger(x)C family spore germination protein [Bacillus sp. EB106-08-02-XG196]|uniref:Ger(x)C family spore germination protein n=1 Tax=Bacillus sp. EB106-08-02-XG196 TaxID=2737049 RepID=UPI0015C49760|nr:Ger(x)C family spore germination protein [Bacillus sp. EB106-08-02-XG196]NWQ43812.1 Ger(x)C family spore germination protein [Bacillus sp. EB106-08-02-XG196]
MKKKRWLRNWTFSFLLMCGCAEPRILEEVGLITTYGLDLAKNGTILGTVVGLKIDPSAPNEIVNLETEAFSIRGIRNNTNRKTSKRLASGQLRVIVNGEELLKQGDTGIAEAVANDPSVSDMTYLAMAEGAARDLLNVKAKHIPDIGDHLFRLIDQNTKGKMMPSATLHEVLHSHYTVGKEPIMPILKKEKEGIGFSGVALFRGSKLVGKISTDQSFFLNMIIDQYKSGIKDVVIKSSKLKPRNRRLNKTVASIDSLDSSNNIKLINKEKVEFDLDIKLTARLLEITSQIDLGKPENIKLIEKEISKSMKEEIEKLIAYCQTKESDVFGLGEIYRSSIRHSKLTDEKWYKMFKEAKVNVNLDFTVKRTGLNQ